MNHKGQMRIVEVLIAIVLVFASSLLVASTYSILPPPVSYQRLELVRQGYNILSKLDQRESLAFLIYLGVNSSNWSVMVEILGVEFAQNIFFNVTIWDTSDRIVNNVPVSNARSFQEIYQNARFAASIRYFVAGFSFVNPEMTRYDVQDYVLELVVAKVI